MARRYGGAHSPDAPQGDGRERIDAAAPAGPFEGKVRAPFAARTWLLSAVAALAVVPGFFASPVDLAFHIGAGAALFGAATLTREGAKAEAAYHARAAARRPAVPRKMMGAALSALALGLLGATWDGVLAAPVLAVLGGALHLAAFGIDPLKNKLPAGADDYQSDRVARMVEDAEATLREMRERIATLGDRALTSRIERFAAAARRLFRQVEADPRDLTQARRYLGVYLRGARDATDKFAAYYARTKDADARRDYLAFLDDMEGGFAQRTERLMLDDRTGLDIELEVLRDRLRREGVKVES